jgi:hypothetical protein
MPGKEDEVEVVGKLAGVILRPTSVRGGAFGGGDEFSPPSLVGEEGEGEGEASLYRKGVGREEVAPRVMWGSGWAAGTRGTETRSA